MKGSGARRPFWLLVPLLLLWPMAAAGHGPGGHEPTRADQVEGAKTAEQPENIVPENWLRERTGDFLPLDAAFKNERGATVTLRQLIDRPTLLLPTYYRCPTSCSFDLANLADAVRRSSHAAGSFRIVSLSFNAEETAETAAAVRPNYTQLLAKTFPEDAWVFLTGDQVNIRKVTHAIGYTFKKKDDLTFIHPSALVVLDKDGRIIKYVYGAFIPGDVDLALAEAAKGTPATSIHRFLSFCFPANPRQNQQVLAYFKMGAAMVLLIGGICFLLFLRRKNPNQPTSHS